MLVLLVLLLQLAGLKILQQLLHLLQICFSIAAAGRKSFIKKLYQRLLCLLLLLLSFLLLVLSFLLLP